MQSLGEGDESEEFLMDLPALSLDDSSKDIEALHDHHKHYFEAQEVLTTHTPDQSIQTTQPSPHGEKAAALAVPPSVVKHRKLSLSDAGKLLDSFHKRAPYFPFVTIPEDATVQSLSRKSPFLLLSIFTVASQSDQKLYQQIDHEYRRILSMKVIVAGEKSLDFLQGILVYIAWYV